MCVSWTNLRAIVAVVVAAHDSGQLPPDMYHAADSVQVRSKHMNNPEGDADEQNSSSVTLPIQDPPIQGRPSERTENNISCYGNRME